VLGGYVYFNSPSKFNKTFIATDLTSETTWENFDEAIAKKQYRSNHELLIDSQEKSKPTIKKFDN
jgi:hypothetical protein